MDISVSDVIIDRKGQFVWKFKLPEQDYVSGEFKYRSTPKQLLAIHYLAEKPAGIFIDALQVRRVKPE